MDGNKEKKSVAGAQVAKLVDLADYREGSIVSRTIIDRKTGTVTFFAFDEGQGLSEHTAPYDALICLLDGEAEIAISCKATSVEEAEMIVIPAKKTTRAESVEKVQDDFHDDTLQMQTIIKPDMLRIKYIIIAQQLQVFWHSKMSE